MQELISRKLQLTM